MHIATYKAAEKSSSYSYQPHAISSKEVNAVLKATIAKWASSMMQFHTS
jgi:hypothetical protein